MKPGGTLVVFMSIVERDAVRCCPPLPVHRATTVGRRADARQRPPANDGGVNWKERFGELGSWIGFWVGDVDATYDRLRTRSDDVTPPVDREFGIRMVTATDPEGHEWGFMRRMS